jgi:hypothetical protein
MGYFDKPNTLLVKRLTNFDKPQPNGSTLPFMAHIRTAKKKLMISLEISQLIWPEISLASGPAQPSALPQPFPYLGADIFR